MDSIKATEHICEMLNEKKKVTAQEIYYMHKIAPIQIYGVMKKLESAGAIIKEEIENGKLYKLVNTDNLTEYLGSLGKKNENDVIEKKPEKKNELTPKSGRNTSKYIFQKQTLPKGQCVLAVVRHYLEKYPSTLKQLQDVFPNHLIGKFGVVQSLADAKRLSDRPRYFIKDNQILSAKDGKVVVCSQWTSDRFEKFLEISKGLGYNITSQ